MTWRWIGLGLAALVLGGLAWFFTRPVVVGGYTDRVSYTHGDTVRVYLDGGRPRRGALIRLFGVRGQAWAAVETDVTWQRPQTPAPWQDGFGYAETFRYVLPERLPSGVYLWEGVAPFVVRGDTAGADVVVVYPSNTIAAYNDAGGKSLYGPSRAWKATEALRRLVTLRWDEIKPDHYAERARVVSFQRPGGTTHREHLYAFLRWMKRQPFRTRYLADQDLDDPAHLDGARLLVIAGHSEYWTRAARRTVDRYLASGRPLLVLSGNTMWWQARYDTGPHGDGRLVVHREWELDDGPDSLKTVLWTDARLDYPIIPSIGARFDLGGYGLHDDDGWDGYRLVAPDSPLLDGVALADGVLDLPTREYDGTYLLPPPSPAEPPRIDSTRLGAYRAELIGYDRGWRDGPTVGTFVVFQQTATSGVVVNAASMDWCGDAGIDGPDSTAVRQITRTAIRRLLAGEDVFSEDVARSASNVER